MNKREVVRMVLEGKRPPYVPWDFGFTIEALEKLHAHLGQNELDDLIEPHFLGLGSDMGFFTELADNCVRDVFKVIWDRTVDRDIGVTRNTVLLAPTLDGYTFPDPVDERFFANIPEKIEEHSDRFRVFRIGFSLFERAWTLRGMENLLMDFVVNPEFVHEFMTAIADYNIAQVRRAVEFDIDAVYFGDDWGQQHGLLMGPGCWNMFLRPQLERMYAEVRKAGKFVMIHSCGDVNMLFDQLIEIGLDCFNPFQPEVMDIESLLERYRGRVAFHGGLSTQKTLPFGSVEDVRRESRHLLRLGVAGGYIFAPAHAVEGDVPLENILAFIEEARSQDGLPDSLKR